MKIKKAYFILPLGFFPYSYLMFNQPDWHKVMDPLAHFIYYNFFIPISIIIAVITVNLIILKGGFKFNRALLFIIIISILISSYILLSTIIMLGTILIKEYNYILILYIFIITIPAAITSGLIIYYFRSKKAKKL